MDFFEAALGRRSVRRFRQGPVAREDLDRMIDAGRYAPTPFNRQPVRFAVISSPEKVAEAFPFTGWLTGPPEDERPAAYLVILLDTQVTAGMVSAHCATTAVMMAAHALGYGSCWHGAKAELREFLGLPDHLEPSILISLGRPAETAEVHDPSDDTQVRKDEDGVVHVGKRGRDEVTVAVA